MHRRALALFLAVSASFVLAGCGSAGAPGAASTPSPTPQTVEEACKIVAKSEIETAEAMSGFSAQSDPKRIVAALEDAAVHMQETVGKLDNAEVAAAAGKLGDFYTDFAGIARAVLIDGDMSRTDEMSDAVSSLTDIALDYAKLCNG
jgi:hypothetical protein